MKNRPLVLAHRGFSAVYPENTLLAFDEAAKVGALAFEFDVQLDGEGEAVVFHDFELGRTTLEEDAGTRVRELSTEDFLELDVGSYKDFSEFYDTPPALLSEVLARYPKIFLNIELKIFDEEDTEEIATLAQRTIEIIREQNWTRGIISSFCPAILRAIKALEPKIPTALLGGKISEENLLSEAIAMKAAAYNFDGRAGVTAQDIQKIHAAGLKACAYTINDVARARELIEMGIDGFFSDDPDLMIREFGTAADLAL